MVCDTTTDDTIRWTSEGNSFIITSCEILERTVFVKYFISKKFSSFVRQLNMYGFHKTGPPDHWEFYHDHFLRGRPQLLQLIKRKKGAEPKGVKASVDVQGDIVTLKREREVLQQGIECLRAGHRALEDQLSVVLRENADMRRDIILAREEQAVMQATVQQILDLLKSSVSDDEPPAKRPRPNPFCGSDLPFASSPRGDDVMAEFGLFGFSKPPSYPNKFVKPGFYESSIDAAIDAALRSPTTVDVDAFVTNLLRM